MKNKFIYLLLCFLILQPGCDNSTQPDSNSTQALVTIFTDSSKYVLNSDFVCVYIQIKNSTDSTLVFPACGLICKRIDRKQGNIWSKGFPEWDSPCQAIYLFYACIESDSTYYDRILIDTTGTFRVVTAYGLSSGFYPDTIYSNEFTVL